MMLIFWVIQGQHIALPSTAGHFLGLAEEIELCYEKLNPSNCKIPAYTLMNTLTQWLVDCISFTVTALFSRVWRSSLFNNIHMEEKCTIVLNTLKKQLCLFVYCLHCSWLFEKNHDSLHCLQYHNKYVSYTKCQKHLRIWMQ